VLLQVKWGTQTVSQRDMPVITAADFLRARCPSCRPTNSIQALNANN